MPFKKIKKHQKSLLAAVLERYIFFYQKNEEYIEEALSLYIIMLLNLQQFMKLLT